MPGQLYALPSSNVAGSATPSWAVSSADASYPVTNVLTLDPGLVAKAVAVTATLRLTFGVAQLLEGIVCINTNWTGLTVALTNNGGMATQNRAFVSPEDEVCINGWWDLRDVSGTSATQWNVAVTGAPSNVAIGTILAITSWDAFKTKWGYEMADLFQAIERRTSHKKRMRYRIPVRYRSFTSEAFWAEDRNAMRTLRRSTLGQDTPFAFIPDETDHDAALVQFQELEQPETYEFTDGRYDAATASGVVPMPLVLEEVNAGVALI